MQKIQYFFATLFSYPSQQPESEKDRPILLDNDSSSDDDLQQSHPLVSSGGQQITNTFSTTIPDYYVIVGCGTAALDNPTPQKKTQWGKIRIGAPPIMKIF